MNRPRPSPSRPLATALSAAALACTAFACGAPATEPAAVGTSEAISCTSDGIHIDSTCGSGGIQPKPPAPPPPAPTPPATLPSPPPASAGCNVNDACSVEYATVEYPAPIIQPSVVAPECTADTTFAEALAAAGCTWTMVYTPGGTCEMGGSASGTNCPYYVTWCPTVPAVTDYSAWTTLTCNTCTGAPPKPGWVLFAYAGSDTTCDAQPGGGCHMQACLD